MRRRKGSESRPGYSSPTQSNVPNSISTGIAPYTQNYILQSRAKSKPILRVRISPRGNPRVPARGKPRGEMLAPEDPADHLTELGTLALHQDANAENATG